MPEGKQIWNADASRLIVDYTDYLGHFIGTFDTGGAVSGTQTISALVGRNIAAFAVSNNGVDSQYGGPILSFNNGLGQISWTYDYASGGSSPYPTPPSSHRQHTIAYGVA